MRNVGTKNLETKRLILRRLELSDAERMYNEWCTDENVTRYLPWNVHKNIEETKELLNMWIQEYEKEDTYRWGIVEKKSNLLFGTIDVVKLEKENDLCEIGYASSRNFWGNGYMTEALLEVEKFLFKEVKIGMITAKHNEENQASGKVMAKANMITDGTLRKRIIDKDGKRANIVYHSILKEEYEMDK